MKSISFFAASLLSLSAASIGAVLTETTVPAKTTARTLTATIVASNKMYDGNTSATIMSCSLSGVAPPDHVSCTGSNGQFDNASAGTGKTVTAEVALSGTDAGNYKVAPTATTKADIAKATLTVTGITASDRIYDRTTVPTLNVGRAALVGVVRGDTVTLDTSGAVGTFSDKSVGKRKTVSISGLTIGGAQADEYMLTQPTMTASITPMYLTVSGITASNKIYDAITAATIDTTGAVPNGVISGDTVTLDKSAATGAFADKNVGTGKTVQISGLAIGGTDSGNYTLTQPTATADITPLAITGSITASNKVYDGTTPAAIATRNLFGVISSDVVSYVGGTATFADKTVGTGKTVTATGLFLSGADVGNYTVNGTTRTTADITPKTAYPNVTANSRIYDGTTAATLSSQTLTAVLATDAANVSLMLTAANFDTKKVGTGKTIAATGLGLSGTEAENYVLSSTSATTTADITTKGLTVSGIMANNKIYDGTTGASLSVGRAALVGRVSGDDVTLNTGSAVGTFASKPVGTGKLATVSGLAISGADAGNYTLTQPATTADIIARELTVSGITADNKVYDGNTIASLNTGRAALVNKVSGDDVTLSVIGAMGTFDNANFGTSKVVTIAGLTISGADAGNYTLTQPTTAANITAQALNIVVLPFTNLSGVERAPSEIAASFCRGIERKGYRTVPADRVEAFLAERRVRYLDSLSGPVREKLLSTLGASAVVFGTVYSFAEGENAIVGVSARMLAQDGAVEWAGVAGLSAEDTQGALGLYRTSSPSALAEKAVKRLLRNFPDPGKTAKLASARARPLSGDGPATYRSETLEPGRRHRICVMPLENRSRPRFASRVVAELLSQRLAASGIFRVVEPAEFREAMATSGMRGIKTGEPAELAKLSRTLGSSLFLRGTIYVFKDASPRNAAVTPELELDLALVDVSTGRIVWTSRLSRTGRDYEGLLELGAISNIVTLTDQVAAEMVRAADKAKGKGASRPVRQRTS